MPQVESIEAGESTIRILITTDNHVGYNENDPVRGDDAWKTFEEIMYIARDSDVDMVLQAGDLFHINKPSKKSLYHVMKTLRRTCFGDRPCELELLSDPSLVFDDGFNTVNYEDPNLNISLPVFSISGNHDDASGQGLLSPLDLLNVSGLINHFGRVTQSDNINIAPLLLQKGVTKLALFGLASVRDERLFKSFRDGNVKFNLPSVRTDEWFNLMAVHQNHAAHSNTAYLPEHFLPSFLDLVIWGHEHECIPYTVRNAAAGFETLQPGSSVATSLCAGEAVEKKIFILNINQRDYSLEPIKLKTVRPFHMCEIALSSIPWLKPGLAYKNEVNQFLIEKVEGLIEAATKEYKKDNPDINNLPLPLIRLRVDYTGGYEVENPRRFSNRFVGRVANINSVIQFHRKTTNNGKSAKLQLKSNAHQDDGPEENMHVETLVNSYLKETELSLLPEQGMNDAIKQFVDKEDKSALKDFIESELVSEIKILLQNKDLNIEDNFKKILKDIKKERASQPPEAVAKDADYKGLPSSVKPKNHAKSEDIVLDSDDGLEEEVPITTKKLPRKRKASSTKKGTIEVVDSDIDSLSDNLHDILSDDESDFDIDENQLGEGNEPEVVDILPSPNVSLTRPTRTTGRSRRTTRGRGSKGASTSRRAPKSSQPTPVADRISGLLSRKKK